MSQQIPAIPVSENVTEKLPVVGGFRHAEKFSRTDLSALREELQQSGLDSWQAAELITSFLTMRGFGVSTSAARSAALRIEAFRCSMQSLQEELDRLAWMM